MKIIIYESSSFGGCYDYSQQLVQAYAQQNGVESVELLVPKTAPSEISGVKKILLQDELDTNTILVKKLWFVFRVFLNPLLLFFYLLFKKKRYVLLNDFEQLSTWFWSPLYRLFLRRHMFTVFLHDPDRDAYPPSKKISSFLMKIMMSAMDIAFYHEILPDKPYYKGKRTKYVAVPHGIYPAPAPDTAMLELLNTETKKRYTFALIGNIREEKNTDLAIRALTKLPDAHLIVAGKAASSSVDIDAYRQLAQTLQVNNRITWITRFLSEAELSAVISHTNAVLLYYRATFASQSAIVNLIAPFRKVLIVSDTHSALTETVRRFGNGIIAPPDNADELALAMQSAIQQNRHNNWQWDSYVEYASWNRNAHIAVEAMQM